MSFQLSTQHHFLFFSPSNERISSQAITCTFLIIRRFFILSFVERFSIALYRMALRTFHANPSLGGFGNESSNAQLWLDRTGTTTTTTTTTTQSKNDEAIDGDAFAQIIKELVDNAVDACLSPNQEDASPKRVRVEIQPTKEDDHLLRVTVTDNGCGMDNIQACVNPFRTSKQDTESNTAGRYGIGLTLCLLHAQRLVRGSCAVIRSATAQQKEWTTLQCVVDADQDKIHCTTRIRGHQPKHFVQESGTCVSLLVRVRNCGSSDGSMRSRHSHTKLYLYFFLSFFREVPVLPWRGHDLPNTCNDFN